MWTVSPVGLLGSLRILLLKSSSFNRYLYLRLSHSACRFGNSSVVGGARGPHMGSLARRFWLQCLDNLRGEAFSLGERLWAFVSSQSPKQKVLQASDSLKLMQVEKKVGTAT